MTATAIPLMPGPWRPLSPGLAAGFEARLRALVAMPLTHQALAPHHRLSGLRAMPLSFYPGWALIEGEATLETGLVGSFDVLYGPGLMWLIDGESRVLNDLHAGRVRRNLDRYLVDEQDSAAADYLPSPLDLDATPDAAAAFLRFYCACVWGDDGPFMPVESADSPVLRGLSGPGDWTRRLHPIALRREGEDLLAEGVIAYGRALFETRLRIRAGSVTMEDDHPIATDALPPRSHARPLRDLRPPD